MSDYVEYKGFRPDGKFSRHPDDPHVVRLLVPEGGTVHFGPRVAVSYLLRSLDSAKRAQSALKDLYKRLQGKTGWRTDPFGPEVDGILWAIQENWWRAWGVELKIVGIPKECVRLTTDGMLFTDLDKYGTEAPGEVAVDIFTPLSDR